LNDKFVVLYDDGSVHVALIVPATASTSTIPIHHHI
jgi:hypothetical protein